MSKFNQRCVVNLCDFVLCPVCPGGDCMESILEDRRSPRWWGSTLRTGVDGRVQDSAEVTDKGRRAS
jgi:hypothetical protein